MSRCLLCVHVWLENARERGARFGAFGVVKWCNDGPDALSCACAMYCMLQGSREYILDRLSHRGSVVVSEKAGTGRRGRFFPPWLGSELGGMGGSIANLYFVI